MAAAGKDIMMARQSKKTRTPMSRTGEVMQHVFNAIPDQRWITLQLEHDAKRMYKKSMNLGLPDIPMTKTMRDRALAADSRLQLPHDTIAFRYRLRGTPDFPVPRPIRNLHGMQPDVTHPAPGGTSDDDAIALQCTLSAMPLFLEVAAEQQAYENGESKAEEKQQRMADRAIQIMGLVHGVDSTQDNASRTTIKVGCVSTAVPQEDCPAGCLVEAICPPPSKLTTCETLPETETNHTDVHLWLRPVKWENHDLTYIGVWKQVARTIEDKLRAKGSPLTETDFESRLEESIYHMLTANMSLSLLVGEIALRPRLRSPDAGVRREAEADLRRMRQGIDDIQGIMAAATAITEMDELAFQRIIVPMLMAYRAAVRMHDGSIVGTSLADIPAGGEGPIHFTFGGGYA